MAINATTNQPKMGSQKCLPRTSGDTRPCILTMKAPTKKPIIYCTNIYVSQPSITYVQVALKMWFTDTPIVDNYNPKWKQLYTEWDFFAVHPHPPTPNQVFENPTMPSVELGMQLLHYTG
jgi:hypothetical protein